MNAYPRRTRRLKVIFTSRSRPLFFVTICTAGRRSILATAATHDCFLEFVGQSPERSSVYIGRYVLMPDHLHVFVSANGSKSLSRWVGSLKNCLASRWRKMGNVGPYWQSGFFDHVLRARESYNEKWTYVELNPVRAGLVADSSEWPFAGEVYPLSWE